MTALPDHVRFGNLSYDDFRRLADDADLAPNERAGFPRSLRDGADEAILADILAKLPALAGDRATVLDIGPGCSTLSGALLALCDRAGHRVVLVDSAEMLAHHAEVPLRTKVPGRFPACADALAQWRGGFDAIVSYSVLQYAFAEGCAFGFLDAALALLAPGGRLLLGDVPNASMRRRFLAGAAGAAHHRAWSGRDEDPPVTFNTPVGAEIDDAVLAGLLLRARAAGFHAWVVPQASGLPMANRREDILVERP
jgi:SAM-dependent methyltransferase